MTSGRFVVLGFVLSLLLAAGCSKAATSVPASSALTSTTSSTTTVSAAQFWAQSVSFVSDDDGFVLGAVRCTTGWCTTLRYTNDRGAHWTTVTAPPAPISINRPAGVTELRFADESDGFAFGPGLWVTHDGANTWHAVHLPGAVLTLAVESRAVYAVVAPCWPFTRPCFTPGSLYQSSVGSSAWTKVLSLAAVGLPLAPVTYAQLALKGSAAYLLASISGMPSHYYLLGSVNGTKFTRLSDPCPRPTASAPAGYGPVDIAVNPVGRLALLCGDGVAMGSEAKKLYVSSNGGKSYRQVATPPFEGDVGELAFPSSTTLVTTAVSGASFIYRTTRSDRTWTTPLSFADGGAGFYDLGFSDANDGAVIHGPATIAITTTASASARLGTLYLTNDGGASWYPVSVSA